MAEEKELAFWLVKNGWAATAPQGLRFVRSATAGECTEEMMDALSMKVLLEKGLEPFAINDLSRGLPEAHEDEVLELLSKALQDAEKMIEYWHKHPSDTNAKFFRMSMKNADWETELTQTGE